MITLRRNARVSFPNSPDFCDFFLSSTVLPFFGAFLFTPHPLFARSACGVFVVRPQLKTRARKGNKTRERAFSAGRLRTPPADLRHRSPHEHPARPRLLVIALPLSDQLLTRSLFFGYSDYSGTARSTLKLPLACLSSGSSAPTGATAWRRRWVLNVSYINGERSKVFPTRDHFRGSSPLFLKKESYTLGRAKADALLRDAPRLLSLGLGARDFAHLGERAPEREIEEEKIGHKRERERERERDASPFLSEPEETNHNDGGSGGRSFQLDLESLQGRLPMYLPDISRRALAQSKGSMKEMKA